VLIALNEVKVNQPQLFSIIRAVGVLCASRFFFVVGCCTISRFPCLATTTVGKKMSDSEDVKGDPETRKRRFEEEAMAHAEVESTNPIMHSPLDIPPTIVPAEYETETPLLKKGLDLEAIHTLPIFSSERIELAVPEETLYFKVLIPNTIIGNIIGKAGACVNGMMMTTRAKIKVSQNHEFFPETDDRILVISGPSDNIQYAIYEIITKFCEVLVHSSLPISFSLFLPFPSLPLALHCPSRPTCPAPCLRLRPVPTRLHSLSRSQDL
jgi:hypothetical protein